MSTPDHLRAAGLYVRGQTLREVGAALGVNNTTVHRWLREAGIPVRARGTRPAPAPTSLIISLRDEAGLTWPRVAAEVGMSITGVRRRYRAATEPGWTRW